MGVVVRAVALFRGRSDTSSRIIVSARVRNRLARRHRSTLGVLEPLRMDVLEPPKRDVLEPLRLDVLEPLYFRCATIFA